MIFTLEALQAEHGDALLLHWDGPDGRHLILIDGGPPIVWSSRLQGRLEDLRIAIVGEEEKLPIKVVMVSHVDDDHIGGLVSMTRELRQDVLDRTELTLDIRDLWHNAFEDILDDASAPAALASVSGLGASAASTSIANTLPVDDSAAVIASIDQGRALRDNARGLRIPINSAFHRQLIKRPRLNAKPKDLGDGLTLEVLGPRADRLEELQKEWKKVLAKKKKGTIAPAEVAAFLDKSPFNLSSIIVIARANGKSILLTGDARGDDILEALTKAKRLVNGKVHFNVFKVPHHGSARNVTEDFFRAVTATNYVISANGRDDNPDRDMLAMLVAARGKDKYTIHLTNPVPHALRKLKSLETKGNFKLVVRDKSKQSMLIELGTKLPAKQKP